jgi:hypothetical protein
VATEEVTLIRRGVARWEYIAYFQALGTEVEPGRFTGPDWEVQVGEERQVTVLRSWSMLEVPITFRGESDRVKQLVDAFRMQFLRAGA